MLPQDREKEDIYKRKSFFILNIEDSQHLTPLSVMSGSRVRNELSDIDFRVLCLIAINSIFHLAAEGTDEALNGPSCRVTQGADGVTFNLERKFLKHVDFSEVRIPFLYTS